MGHYDKQREAAASRQQQRDQAHDNNETLAQYRARKEIQRREFDNKATNRLYDFINKRYDFIDNLFRGTLAAT